MLSSISGPGETGPEHKWSNGTEFSIGPFIQLFRFSGILGHPREVHLKFRNEIPENVSAIPFASPPGISGIFGRMESAPGRDELVRRPEVNLLNRACARELSTRLCRRRLVEDAISTHFPSFRKREYFALVLPWHMFQSTLFSVTLVRAFIKLGSHFS